MRHIAEVRRQVGMVFPSFRKPVDEGTKTFLDRIL